MASEESQASGRRQSTKNRAAGEGVSQAKLKMFKPTWRRTDRCNERNLTQILKRRETEDESRKKIERNDELLQL